MILCCSEMLEYVALSRRPTRVSGMWYAAVTSSRVSLRASMYWASFGVVAAGT